MATEQSLDEKQMACNIALYINSLNITSDDIDLKYTIDEILDVMRKYTPRYYYLKNFSPTEGQNLECASIHFMYFVLQAIPNGNLDIEDLNYFIRCADMLYDYRHMLYELYDKNFAFRCRPFIHVEKDDVYIKRVIDAVIISLLERPIGPRYINSIDQKLYVLDKLFKNVFEGICNAPTKADIYNIITTRYKNKEKVEANTNNTTNNEKKVLNLCKGARQGWDKKYGEPNGPDEDLIIPF